MRLLTIDECNTMRGRGDRLIHRSAPYRVILRSVTTRVYGAMSSVWLSTVAYHGPMIIDSAKTVSVTPDNATGKNGDIA